MTINEVVTTRLAQDVCQGGSARSWGDWWRPVWMCLCCTAIMTIVWVLVVPPEQEAIAAKIAAAWDVSRESRENVRT